MQITNTLKNNILVIQLTGEVDLYHAPKIKDVVLEKIKEGHDNIIIDLEKVTYIDSTGIGSLIFSRTTINKNGGNLILINIKDSVKKIFELTKLNSFFKICEDVDHALSSITTQ